MVKKQGPQKAKGAKAGGAVQEEKAAAAAAAAAAALPPFIRPSGPTSCLLTVRATPGAKVRSQCRACITLPPSLLMSPTRPQLHSPQNSSVALGAEAVEVRIDAPPVEGKANDAIVEYLASLLGLKRRAVSLSSGAKSREKVLKVEMGAPAALELLRQHAAAS